MSLIIYKGIVLIATIAAVFQAKPRETTNVMSEDQKEGREHFASQWVF
jgi:hypothetical protein